MTNSEHVSLRGRVEELHWKKERHFESFFQDSLYLYYKNHLYNYLVRRRTIREGLQGRPKRRTLELGCGTSPILRREEGAIHTDLSWRALSHLGKGTFRGTANPFVACTATRLPFKSASVGRVICSEVLEHIEEDKTAIGEINRVLEMGGELHLTCPIHRKYFGFDDRFVGHRRRYEVDDLTALLREAGFAGLEVKPVLGLLEKILMENITRVFSFLGGKGSGPRLLRTTFRLLAWCSFPFYFLANHLLAWVVRIEAQRIPIEQAVTLYVQCRKIA